MRSKKQHISDSKKTLVKIHDNFQCVCCGSTTDLEVDHIIPESMGGSSNLENLQTLCATCNNLKKSHLGDWKNHVQKRLERKRDMDETRQIVRYARSICGSLPPAYYVLFKRYGYPHYNALERYMQKHSYKFITHEVVASWIAGSILEM